MAPQANRLGSSRERKLRAQKADPRDPLAALLGANGYGQGL